MRLGIRKLRLVRVRKMIEFITWTNLDKLFTKIANKSSAPKKAKKTLYEYLGIVALIIGEACKTLKQLISDAAIGYRDEHLINLEDIIVKGEELLKDVEIYKATHKEHEPYNKIKVKWRIILHYYEASLINKLALKSGQISQKNISELKALAKELCYDMYKIAQDYECLE